VALKGAASSWGLVSSLLASRGSFNSRSCPAGELRGRAIPRQQSAKFRGGNEQMQMVSQKSAFVGPVVSQRY